MTRNKKILIGAGIAVVLGGVAYANFRFKRVEGVTVHTEAIQKRDLKAIVSASGKIQPKRFVNISADTSGRVTDLAVQEGERVKQGQFLLADRPAQPAHARPERRSLARRRPIAARADAALAGELAYGAQAGRGCLPASAEPRQGRADDEGNARAGGERPGHAKGRPGLARAEPPHAAAAHGAGAGDARERQDGSQQSPHRIADRRHHHPPEHRTGRDRGGRHDEQRRHRAAAGGRHVGHRGRGRGRRDRYPERAARPDRHDHGRRDQRQDVHREGDRDRQQPDSGDRSGLDPGHQLQGDADGRGRDSRRQARLHLHRRHHDRHPRPGAGRADPGDDGPRGRGRRQGAGRACTSDRGAASVVDHRPGVRVEAGAGAQGARGRLRGP